ncbi:MAG: hypothetical protein AAF216_12225 [Pseudomonadota bacterium]
MGGPAGVDYSTLSDSGGDGLVIGKSVIKRVWLASFLSAIGAVVAVALAGIVILFAITGISALLGQDNFDGLGPATQNAPIRSGMFVAGLASVLNWYVFYITVPIVTLVLGFSLGRFPKRRIVRPLPYFRWGAIWGAVLVTAPCLFGVAVTGGWDETTATQVARYGSGGLTGMLIGGVSGAAIGGLWLAIVRPARQIRDVDTSVFT